jgi:ATP-binding cassette subfamily C protein CydC
MIGRVLADAARRQRRATHLALILAVMAAMAGVALLAVSGWFLTGAAIAGAAGVLAARDFNYLLPSAAIRAFAIIRTLGRYGERLFGHKAALFALAEVRPALFARLAGAEPDAALSRSGGEVAAQLGSDVDALEDAVVRRVTLPGAIAAGLAGLAAAFLAGPAAALALAAGLAFMRLVSWLAVSRLIAPPTQCRGEALTRVKAAYAEYAACSAEIAVYGLAPRIMEALAPDIEELEASRQAVVRGEAIVQGAQLVLAGLTVAAVLALSRGGAPAAALAALAAAGAAEAWAGLTRSDMQQVRVRDARRRLESIVSLPARRVSRADEGKLAAQTIAFAIGGNECRIAPGDRLLIAGPSGAGKSRLLGTLAGLRADAPELVRVGDEDVRALGLETLRRLFACAPQDAALIAGTVADNLRLAGRGVTHERMWEALETACLADTVRALPGGLDQWLGGDGARLSGGQRKRLSLARSLLAGRPWLLLDEPSEGLDAATELQLRDNLGGWLDRSATGLVLVSHREAMQPLASRVLSLGPVAAAL